MLAIAGALWLLGRRSLMLKHTELQSSPSSGPRPLCDLSHNKTCNMETATSPAGGVLAGKTG